MEPCRSQRSQRVSQEPKTTRDKVFTPGGAMHFHVRSGRPAEETFSCHHPFWRDAVRPRPTPGQTGPEDGSYNTWPGSGQEAYLYPRVPDEREIGHQPSIASPQQRLGGGDRPCAGATPVGQQVPSTTMTPGMSCTTGVIASSSPRPAGPMRASAANQLVEYQNEGGHHPFDARTRRTVGGEACDRVRHDRHGRGEGGAVPRDPGPRHMPPTPGW